MGADPAKNDWELRFGNKRRRIDRDLLAEAERQIAREERLISELPTQRRLAPSTAKSSVASPARSVARPLDATRQRAMTNH